MGQFSSQVAPTPIPEQQIAQEHSHPNSSSTKSSHPNMVAHNQSRSFGKDGQDEVSPRRAEGLKTEREDRTKRKAGRSMPQHCRGTAIMPSQQVASNHSIQNTRRKKANAAGSAQTNLAAVTVQAEHSRHFNDSGNCTREEDHSNSTATPHSPKQRDPKTGKRAGAQEEIAPTKRTKTWESSAQRRSLSNGHPNVKSITKNETQAMRINARPNLEPQVLPQNVLEQLDGSVDPWSPGIAETESEIVITETYPGEYAALNRAIDDEPDPMIRDAMVNHYFAEDEDGVILGMSGVENILRKLRPKQTGPRAMKRNPHMTKTPSQKIIGDSGATCNVETWKVPERHSTVGDR